LQNQYVLVSAFYDGKLKRVGLKFYDTLSRTIKIVHDSSGFMPYFISTAPVEELEALKGKRNDIARLEPVTLFDSIADKPVVATKVVVTDPLAISGGDEGKPGLRDMVDAHEADIKTYLNYLYDNSLIPGT
jgi:DNA polymerase elongation subunit (family B)